ncbi:MAG TPA: phage portal protein [Anaerolineae bacterium]|jgi:hypothetical protein
MRTTSADARERDRYSAYGANESFYNGDAAAQLTVMSTVKRDEVRAVFNYARDILNKHAAATISGLRSSVIDHDTGAMMPGEHRPRPTNASSLAQSLLDRALAQSNDTTTDFAACLQGTVLGDSAYYITHEDGEVFYRLLHPGDVDVLHWSASGRPARVMVQHEDRIETWTNQTLTIDAVDSPHPAALPMTFANPYGVIPIVIWPNWPRIGSRWGDSTLEHIKAAARLLNERLDLLMWLVRVQGNPPIKALGVDKATLRTDPGELWTGPADAQIDLVKLMDAETAGIHQQTIRLLLSIVKELSNTPDIAYGIGNTQLSGRALEMAYMPMIQAANVRRGFLADAVRQRNRIILRMVEVLNGIDLRGCYDTAVTFTPVVPADRMEERIQDRQDVQLGTLAREVYAARYL